jgi:phosphatidylglycerophosphate synthase
MKPEETPVDRDIVLEWQDALRADHYSLVGWARFLARAWRGARSTARAHPRLTRSWRRVALGLALASGGALVAEAGLGGAEGRAAARLAAPGMALGLAYTLVDAYVHLGMNQATSRAPLHETLGVPNILTLSRSAAAGLLFGHLVGRAPASRAVMGLALAVAGLTDIADGQLARKTQRSTRLGAYLDSEADFGIALAMTLTLLARRALPGWLAATLLARWLLPFAGSLLTYFGMGWRLDIGSTPVGKVAGVAQVVAFGGALLSVRVRRPERGVWRATRGTVATLLLAAPLVQLASAWDASRARRPSIEPIPIGAEDGGQDGV